MIIIYRYNTSAATMQEKMLPSKKPAIRKGCELTLNVQPQVCHNKMVMANENFLPFSTGYVLCSMVVDSMLIYEMVYGQKLQTLPCFLRTFF